MNTAAVAKLLGVSPSTIQRWVKQLELQTVRNELGHYFFTEEDIQLLRQVQEQLNKGIILQDVMVEGKKTRKGGIKTALYSPDIDKLLAKMNEFEQRLNAKADDVVSYQLLQHRSEIEELQKEVARLNLKVQELEAKQTGFNKNLPADTLLVFDQQKPAKKMKKKNIITTLFGF